MKNKKKKYEKLQPSVTGDSYSVCLSVTVRLFVHLENGVCSLGCSATAYVRISSWNAYVLLFLLAQSQWRTLRSAG